MILIDAITTESPLKIDKGMSPILAKTEKFSAYFITSSSCLNTGLREKSEPPNIDHERSAKRER
jgi:hypothetical protein